MACDLISIHNVHHHLDLMKRLRESIDKNEVEKFLHAFLTEQFESLEKVPQWVKDATTYAGYKLFA